MLYGIAYLCFIGGRRDEEVEVDCESAEIGPFSSSRCTAIENRFQKAGSRTPAMSLLCRKSSFESSECTNVVLSYSGVLGGLCCGLLTLNAAILSSESRQSNNEWTRN